MIFLQLEVIVSLRLINSIYLLVALLNIRLRLLRLHALLYRVRYLLFISLLGLLTLLNILQS